MENLKTMRLLSMYERLNRGLTLNKAAEAEHFGVNEKSIQRDIDDLRAYLAQVSPDELPQVAYSRTRNGYYLVREQHLWLSNQEVMALAKVLLESRAFSQQETSQILDKLILQCEPDNRNHIKAAIQNERYHYMPLQHGQPLCDKLWELSLAVRTCRLIEIEYVRVGDDKPVKRIVEPQGLMFSEYYFYLIAYIQNVDKEFPAIYRLDRISRYRILDAHFRSPYANRFEEGEFRKRVQFMNPAKLLQIKFRFWGVSLEAVLDRLPTARVVNQDDKTAIVEAEVYGKGIKMWLLSQAEFLEVLEPAEFRDEMRATVAAMMRVYGGN